VSYWRPVYNLLEGGVELFLVNAHHVKAVPGRKTDVRDSEWLAQLLELGLLRGSFVPPAAQRELRDVVRYRKRLIEDRAREANRVQKVLETANIKLASVVTDVLGVSPRSVLVNANSEGNCSGCRRDMPGTCSRPSSDSALRARPASSKIWLRRHGRGGRPPS
jgi:transposase